jgi:hypothetical protein
MNVNRTQSGEGLLYKSVNFGGIHVAQRKVGHLFDGKFSVMTESIPSKMLYKKSAMCAILIFINGLLKFSGA